MASADKESVSSATARRVRRFMARLEAVCRLEAEAGESPPCLHRSAVCTCRRSESRSYTAPWSRH